MALTPKKLAPQRIAIDYKFSDLEITMSKNAELFAIEFHKLLDKVVLSVLTSALSWKPTAYDLHLTELVSENWVSSPMILKYRGVVLGTIKSNIGEESETTKYSLIFTPAKEFTNEDEETKT